jgi:hypothetical protein
MHHVAKGDNAKAAETFKAAYDAKPEGALAYVALARTALSAATTSPKQMQSAEKGGQECQERHGSPAPDRRNLLVLRISRQQKSPTLPVWRNC